MSIDAQTEGQVAKTFEHKKKQLKDETTSKKEEQPDSRIASSMQLLFNAFTQTRDGKVAIITLADEKEREVLRSYNKSIDFSIKDAGFPADEIAMLHAELPLSSFFFASGDYKGTLITSAIRLKQLIEDPKKNTLLVAELQQENKQSVKRDVTQYLLRHPSISAPLMVALRAHETQTPSLHPISESVISDISARLEPMFSGLTINEKEATAIVLEALDISPSCIRIVKGEEQREEAKSALSETQLQEIGILLDDTTLKGDLRYVVSNYADKQTPLILQRDIKLFQTWKKYPEAFRFDAVKKAYFSSAVPQALQMLHGKEVTADVQRIVTELTQTQPAGYVEKENDIVTLLIAAKEATQEVKESERVDVSGFEFFGVEDVNNEWVSEMYRRSMPAGINASDLPRFHYNDFESLTAIKRRNPETRDNESFVSVTQAVVDGFSIQMYLDFLKLDAVYDTTGEEQRKRIAELKADIQQTTYHEVNHIWFMKILKDHEGLHALNLISDLLEEDFQQGKDIFSQGISKYAHVAVEQFRQEHRDGIYYRIARKEAKNQTEHGIAQLNFNEAASRKFPYIFIEESLAELWGYGQDPDTLERIKTELPAHYEVFLCMRDKAYLDSKLELKTLQGEIK